jgi:RimJ/RimL family protein N-acetyltransferase
MKAFSVSPLVAPPRRFARAPIDRLALSDGRSVVVRPMRASDAGTEQAFVQGLSQASRRARFQIGLRELPPEMLRALTDVDQRCHVAFAAEAPGEDDEERRIVADARYIRTGEPGVAEVAVTVHDAWQGVGLGRELLQRLLRHAGRRRVTRLYGDVLHDNAPMLAMARAMGARLSAVPGDATLARAVFELARSSHGSKVAQSVLEH